VKDKDLDRFGLTDRLEFVLVTSPQQSVTI